MRKTLYGILTAALFLIFVSCSLGEEYSGDQMVYEAFRRNAETVSESGRWIDVTLKEYPVFKSYWADGWNSIRVDDYVSNPDYYDANVYINFYRSNDEWISTYNSSGNTVSIPEGTEYFVFFADQESDTGLFSFVVY